MLVEFAGMPGSGKSTLYNSLIEGYTSQELSNFEKLEEAYLEHCVPAFLFPTSGLYPKKTLFYWRFLKYCINQNYLSDFFDNFKRSICYWYLKDISLTSFAVGELSKEAYVLDEGIVQHATGLLAWEKERYRSILDLSSKICVTKPWLVFYINISVEEALGRVEERGYPNTWRKEDRSREKLHEVLGNYSKYFPEIIGFYKDLGAEIIELSSEHDPGLVSKHFAAALPQK